MPSFGSFLPHVRPGVPASTRKAVMPLAFFSGLVIIKMTKYPATGPLVTQDLRPFRM